MKKKLGIAFCIMFVVGSSFAFAQSVQTTPRKAANASLSNAEAERSVVKLSEMDKKLNQILSNQEAILEEIKLMKSIIRRTS